MAELPDALCSQPVSSWVAEDKDHMFMLSLQCHLLFFWKCQEHNKLSGKTEAQESKGCGFLGSLLIVCPFESGLEGLDTSPFSQLVFASPGSANKLSAYVLLSTWLFKASLSSTI